MNGNILSKDNSKILRALAILAIIFHNWFHSGFSVSKCNENSFSAQHLDVFLSSIQSGHNIVVETSSFLGWLGVATFVFLTGYGTALSSPPANFSESIKYIRRNWLKLFLLLLPLVIIYFFLDVLTGNISEDTGKRFIYLTLLTNFVYPFFKCYPHINWYFGLTFQFYLFWGLFGRYITKERILYLGCILLLGLYLCMSIGQRDIISIYTHSFTGWFILFALGIWFAQKPKAVDFLSRTTIMLEISFVIIMSLLMIVMNYSLELWLFLPIVALLFFIFLGKLFLRTNFLSKCLIWIGELSACLFVCYPLSRFAVKSFVVPHVNSLILATIVYVVLDFFLAYFYNLLYKRLLYTFKVKVKKV